MPRRSLDLARPVPAVRAGQFFGRMLALGRGSAFERCRRGRPDPVGDPSRNAAQRETFRARPAAAFIFLSFQPRPPALRAAKRRTDRPQVRPVSHTRKLNLTSARLPDRHCALERADTAVGQQIGTGHERGFSRREHAPAAISSTRRSVLAYNRARRSRDWPRASIVNRRRARAVSTPAGDKELQKQRILRPHCPRPPSGELDQRRLRSRRVTRFATGGICPFAKSMLMTVPPPAREFRMAYCTSGLRR